MLKPDYRLRPLDIMVQQPTIRLIDNNKNNNTPIQTHPTQSISVPPSLPPTTSHSDTHYCPICGQSFLRSNLLADHMHLCHQTEMLFPTMDTIVDYPCQHCDEIFRTTLELDEHVRTAHQMLRFSRCSACGLFGISITNGEYKCIQCGTVSSPLGHNFYPPPILAVQPPPSSMNNHKLPPFTVKLPKPKPNHHHNSSNGVVTATNSSNNSQHHNRNTSGGGNIRNGVHINGNGQKPIKIEIKVEPHNYFTSQTNSGTSNNKRHKCSDCEKTFKTSGTLSVHRRIHTGEAEYKCEFCQKEFIFSEYYIRHLRTHTKERPYSCTYCSKTFTQSNTLKQHTRIHTGEKPFNCIYCEKSFSVKDYLTKHIRTHTGEKPYTCSYCDKRFTQRSALTVHTTKLHPI